MIAILGIGRFRKLDVRPVIARGEQPLARIEEALAKLGSEEALEVHSPFLPAPLIERLSSEGYRYQFEATATDSAGRTKPRADTPEATLIVDLADLIQPIQFLPILSSR